MAIASGIDATESTIVIERGVEQERAILPEEPPAPRRPAPPGRGTARRSSRSSSAWASFQIPYFS